MLPFSDLPAPSLEPNFGHARAIALLDQDSIYSSPPNNLVR